MNNFGKHRHCYTGDLTILICHVTSSNHIFKGSCKFMDGSPLYYVATLPCLVSIGVVQIEKEHI